MEINEIYEIKDMYDVKLLLSKYLDLLEFINYAVDSESFDKEHFKTVIELLTNYTVLNMQSINT